MSDQRNSNYLRVENAVLAFIRDHPGLTRADIYKSLSSLHPHIINVALFLLQEKALIEGQYEHIGDEGIRRRYDPIRIDCK